MTREEALHPDTDPEVLLRLAERFPAEVLQNPLLPMIALENPTLWKKILCRASTQQLKRESSRLSPQDPARLARWQEQCRSRALEKYTPALSNKQREETKKCWESFSIRSFAEAMAHRSGRHQQKAALSLRHAGDHRLPESENKKLFQKAATEKVLHLLFGHTTDDEFVATLLDAAAYTAAALVPPRGSNEARQEAKYTEARCLLALLEAKDT